MPQGENHAKQTVLLQVEALEEHMENNPSDTVTNGRALLLCMQMIKPIFTASLVTTEICETRHQAFEKNLRKEIADEVISKAMSWPKAMAVVGSVAVTVLGICLVVLQLSGKL